MHTFQTFNYSLIRALEAAQPAILALTKTNTLRDLYTSLPSFHNAPAFQAWVKEATLKHPQRRTAKQHQYLHIVALQSQQKPGMSVVDIVMSAISAEQEWRESTYDAANLEKDSDAFYFFTAARSGCGLETLSCFVVS